MFSTTQVFFIVLASVIIASFGTLLLVACLSANKADEDKSKYYMEGYLARDRELKGGKSKQKGGGQ